MKNSRKFKKVASLATAALMAACMAAPITAIQASAAKNTITITDATAGTHTYKAYQIFSGTITENETGSKELSNPEWATGVTGSTLITALKADATIGSLFESVDADAKAAAVAKVLNDIESDSKQARALADVVAKYFADNSITETANGETLTVEADGYYVIVESGANTAGGTKTRYILSAYDASEGVDIAAKASAPSFQKKIKDTNDSTNTDGSTNGEWLDSADYDMTDAVPFQLTATLPSTYDDYKTYNLTFHDDLQSEVFTLNASSIKVYAVNGTGESATTVDITAQATIVTTGLGTDATFASKKTDGTEDFTVEIADLKKVTDAAITKDTKIVVEYDAQLTDKAKIGAEGNWNSGYLEYSNNPNYSGAGENTPEDDKSKTPEDLVVAFTYQLDVDKTDAKGDALEGAGFTLYKKNASDEYVKVGDEITGVTKFSFKGVDAGEYKLVESTVPDGYNKAADLEFVVNATHEQVDADAPKLQTLEVVCNEKTVTASESSDVITGDIFKVTLSSGLAETKVVNTSGAVLPSTGGMGTTLFYIGGGVLVAGAGVLLITKKRTKKD